MTIRIIQTTTRYIKTDVGYEVISEDTKSFSIDDTEDIPQDDWINELLHVSYNYE